MELVSFKHMEDQTDKQIMNYIIVAALWSVTVLVSLTVDMKKSIRRPCVDAA